MGRIEPKEFVLRDSRKGVIRTGEVADTEKILKQITSVLEEAEFTTTTYPEDGQDFTIEKEREWIKDLMDGNGNLLVVAEIDGEIAGSADLQNDQRRRIQHVGSLGITVDKDFRGLGVGKNLIENLNEWASDHPVIEKVALEVFANNVKAIGLYKKLGFIEGGRKLKEFKIAPDKYIDSILMYKFVG